MNASIALPIVNKPEINEAYSQPVSQVISVKQISLTYSNRRTRKQVLSNVSLDIAEGEFVTVLGTSGSGKTSLLRLLAGYERPSSGEIHILGEPSPKPRPEVGVVFQQSNLFPWLTLQRNAEFGLQMKGISRPERKRIAAQTLDLVGIAEYSDYLPYQLSGGLKQRAAIARTLAPGPRIVLMDEPFGALDAITREHLQALVKSLWQQQKRTFFFITHDVDEALYLGTRIIVIGGSLGQLGIDKPNPLFRYDGNVSLLRQHPQYVMERQSLLNALEGK